MKISIITICYNPGAVLRSAVESVLGQSYENVEYIIVDGGSTDGAVEWVSELAGSESRMKVVSEPDEGLYDALNKGVRLATGEVIGFVHADDFLAHDDVLKHVAEIFACSDVDAVYGDLEYVAERGNEKKKLEDKKEKGEKSEVFRVIRHWKSGEYDQKKLTWGWMPPHPTFYLKRGVYDDVCLENGEYFDTSFSCAADYDFMLRVMSGKGVAPAYLPEVMVRMRVGGVSNRSLKHIIRKSLEDWRAIRRNKVGHVHTLVWKNLRKVGQFFHQSKV